MVCNKLVTGLGQINPLLQVENKEPVCFVFLCDQKGWWQVCRLVRLQHPLTAQPVAWLHSGALKGRCRASGRRAGTVVAFLLPLVLHEELESRVNIMGT